MKGFRTSVGTKRRFHYTAGQKKKKKAVKGGILIFVTTREQNIHVQNLLHKKVNAGKMSEHFSHLARKNAVPSFNVSKWEPSSFSFAFPFSPTIICNLSRFADLK